MGLILWGGRAGRTEVGDGKGGAEFGAGGRGTACGANGHASGHPQGKANVLETIDERKKSA